MKDVKMTQTWVKLSNLTNAEKLKVLRELKDENESVMIKTNALYPQYAIMHNLDEHNVSLNNPICFEVGEDSDVIDVENVHYVSSIPNYDEFLI